MAEQSDLSVSLPSTASLAAIADPTVRTLLTLLVQDIIRLRNRIDANVVLHNAHTHYYDSIGNTAGNTSTPDAHALTTGNAVQTAGAAQVAPAVIRITG